MSTDRAGRDREFLRHTLATLAYRSGKVLRGAPKTFGTFKIGETTRSPSAAVLFTAQDVPLLRLLGLYRMQPEG